MKVLLVNKYWYAKGGAEVVAMQTKDFLEAAGHQVAVFAMQHPKNMVKSDLFPVEIDYRKDSLATKIQNVFKTLRNKQAMMQFEKLIQQFQPDVVHFHNIYHQLSYGLLEVTKKYKIRTVMTLHDYKLLSPNYSLYHHGHIDESILGKKYYRCLLTNCMESFPESIVGTLEAYYREAKKYHNLIDVYISPSEFLKKLFVRAGWDKKKIVVIPNPVEIPLHSFREVSQTEGEYVAYIGRLSQEKGLNVLLEAAALTPTILYKVVGTGPEEKSLQKTQEKKNLKNVSFLGWKTGADLQRLYEQARILIVPSVWYENYPLGILEAKAYGKIVLGSNIGGIPEMLDNKFLFQPGDAQDLSEKIKQWYQISGTERKKIGKELQQEVLERNSPKHYVESLEELYHG